MKALCKNNGMKGLLKVMIAVSAIMLFSGCSYLRYVPEETPAKDPASGGHGDENASDGQISAGDLSPFEEVSLDSSWEYADHAAIGSGSAVLYRSANDRKDIVVAVNAGHGTLGGEEKTVYCHPDGSPKVTHGSNPKGSYKAVAVAVGMIFAGGKTEAEVTLDVARKLRDRLLSGGYDVLMIRDSDDVQLDNVARTVIANNMSDCLVSIHFDGDALNYDKGFFYIPVPDEIKDMEPVAGVWKEHERLGAALEKGLKQTGCSRYDGRVDALELTQTCYAKVPAAVVELGNARSDISDEALQKYANGLAAGIEEYMKK